MKHPLFTRSVSLLLAVLMVLSLPAAAIEVSGSQEPVSSAADDGQAETTPLSPFDSSQDTVLPANEAQSVDQEEPVVQAPQQAEPSDPPVNPVYLNADGSYLAPEKLVVYITAYADPEKTADSKHAIEEYTGIVAFYDYNEQDQEKMLEHPYFFYYDKGVLQSEEPLFFSSDRYLSLASAPTQEAGLTQEDEVQTVYLAEEVYVDPEAEVHPNYLFAFNQEEADNGLYTDEEDVPAYLEGLTNVVRLTGLTQAAATANKPTVTWERVSGADAYQIWRSTDGGNTWAMIGVDMGDVGEGSYTDENATEVGTTYTYCVCAIYPDSSTTEKGKSVLSYTCREKLAEVNAVAAAGGIQLSWSEDEAATGYRVLRRVSDSMDSTDTAEWTEIADLNGSDSVKWLDSTASSDVTYSYAVRAYYGTKEGDSREDYTIPVWNCAAHHFSVYYLAAPTLTNVYSNSAGMTLCWNPVAGADSYRVYRKDAAGGSWTNVTGTAKITGTSFTDKTAQAGSSYFYIVRAVKGSLLGPYFDTSKDPASAVAYHAVPAVTVKSGDGLVVSWSKDTTATGYRVFRQKSGETRWVTVADLTGSEAVTYTDTSVVSGAAYSYTVRAYYGQSGKISSDNNYNSNLWSGYKASAALVYVAIPKLGTTYSDVDGMRTNWTAVPNATGYIVYRRVNNAGQYTRIATVGSGTTNYYVDKTAVAGTAYGYTVKATFKAADGKIYTSGYHNPTAAMVYHAAPTVTAAANKSGNVIYWTLDSKATGYRIHRKEGTGAAVVLANIDAAALAGVAQGRYEDKNLASGTKYTYYVRAYYGTDPVNKVGVDYSNRWSGAATVSNIFLATPVLASSASMTATGLKINWAKVTGAAGYQIYRKAEGGSWKKIADLSSGVTETYVDTGTLSVGATYYYTVRAVGTDKTSLSSYDSAGVFAAYLPAPALEAVLVSSTGTTVKWKPVSGASGYIVYRKASGGSWERLATTTNASTLSYKDTAVKNKNTTYYYTVKAYKTATVGGVQRTFYGAYDTNGMTFSISMSGSGWVKKDGNTYYVKDGYCVVGWQYLKRNGGTYKYYFDLKTGALVTNLYSYFGKSYRNLKCRAVVCINTNDSNPSYNTIYLYDSETDSYCIPAVSVRCVGNPTKTTYKSKSAYMKAGTGQRWLDTGSFEQYATYISGTYSWFHSALYFGSKSPNSFSSASYNSLVNNNNSSNGCIRMQCIYAYLIQDIMKNGYGRSNRVPVVLYKNTSNPGPFGVPKVDKISSRKSDPTDPAITGKFFYETSIWGVNAKSGAKAWTYY